MPKVLFKDINIYFEELGQGSSVVLLHGFLEGHWMWLEVAAELAKKHRVLIIDLPGHGKSDCIGYIHTMDEMAEAVKAVVNHLGIRRIDLIGHSMGGYVGLAYAERYPDDLRSLTLYQSTSRADDKEQKSNRDRAITLVKQKPSSFVRQSIPQLFRPVNRLKFKKEINRLKDLALKTPPQGIVAALAGMRDRPNRELLLRFPPYPIHIIAGEKDPRIPLQTLIEQAAISEEVHLHVIKGVGHMSYIEDFDRTITLFKQILK